MTKKIHNYPKTEAKNIYRSVVNGLTEGKEITPSIRELAKKKALSIARDIFKEKKKDFEKQNPNGSFHVTDDFHHLNSLISEIQRF